MDDVAIAVGVDEAAESVVIGKLDKVVPSWKAHATELPEGAATVVKLPSTPLQAHKVCTSVEIVTLVQVVSTLSRIFIVAYHLPDEAAARC